MSKNYVKSFLMGLFVASFLAFATVASAADWYVPGNFATIQEAIDSPSVVDGDTIFVGPGEHFGAIVTKAVEIKGEGGAVIVNGPAHPNYPLLHYGFKLGYGQGGSGATISHLKFKGGPIGDTLHLLAFPVFAFQADDVTVEHCTMTIPIQGITNWEGSGWNISHNVFNGLRSNNGGAIGIFIGCYYTNGNATNNIVSHNTITGEIVIPPDENGGYSGPGICLMSDRRTRPLTGWISGNRIIKNKVSLSSANTALVNSVGIELTDMGLLVNPDLPDLFDNKVGFNDVRGVTGDLSEPIALNPDPDLVAGNNTISRNLGDDINNRRSDGVNPKVFFK